MNVYVYTVNAVSLMDKHDYSTAYDIGHYE
jgi:hypothetical protein